MARIFIVDDDCQVLNVYQTILESEGHEVISSCGGEGVLDGILSLENLDLVITDLNMPGLQGDQLSIKIKEKRPSLPIIMITSGTPGKHQCDMVLTKPVPMHVLIYLVGLYL